MIQTRLILASAALLPLMVGGCEIGPKQVSQGGYRGTGIDQIVNPANLKPQPIPANVYATPDDTGPRASATYQNVQVLGNVSTDRFNHFMAQINNWVVPQEGLPVEEQGCNYCHNPNNMASDEKYTKRVARRMIQMTQNINVNYTTHVQQVGVTCWTCHRGHAAPQYKWAMAENVSHGMLQGKRGQNTPNPSVGYASLPYDPFSAYLKDGGVNNIRVQSTQALPSPAHVVSEKTAETTYGLMMHMSTGLGVNCTFCHNSRAFSQWNQSSPKRVTAWYGLRMVATTNAQYMTPLASVFPAVHPGPELYPTSQYRKGPAGDVYKINCATCHQGLNKPLYGVSMKAENPVLWPAAVATAPVVPAPQPAAKATVAKAPAVGTGAATIGSRG